MTISLFNKLCNSLDLEYFRKCYELESRFDINKFHWVYVVTPNKKEKKQSKNGSFYILDGNHRSLVLATKLLKKECDFKPINVLLLEPRPT
tara:strand:- start:68 stop:340 length:273 start_codon:yes stop_codon:yes gene_type:complete